MCIVSCVPRTATFFQEVRREKSRFFLATNLGWRSENAIIIIIIIVIIIIIIIIIILSIKGPILTSFICIFLRRWPTDIMTTFFFFLMTDLLHAFS